MKSANIYAVCMFGSLVRRFSAEEVRTACEEANKRFGAELDSNELFVRAMTRLDEKLRTPNDPTVVAMARATNLDRFVAEIHALARKCVYDVYDGMTAEAAL